MGAGRRIGYINAYGEICLSDEERGRLFADYSLLEDEDIKEIDLRLSKYRQTLLRRKDYDPNFNEYLVDEMIAPVIVTYGRGTSFAKGGAIPLIEYYENRQTLAYGSAVGYHYNRKRAEMVREFMNGTQPTLEAPDQTGNADLTKENEKALKDLLDQAVKAGLVSECHKWLKTKSLCAYFAYRASEYLQLSTVTIYNNETGNEEHSTNWQIFEKLFGYKCLRACKAEWRKIGKLPKGHKTVDALFPYTH